jgi:hypothetical protein
MNQLNCCLYPNAKGVIQTVLSNTGRIFVKVILITFLLFVFSSNVNAQVPIDASLTMAPINSIFYVEVPDTNSLNEIEVELGSKNEMNDIFGYVFIYDQVVALPFGYSYQRSGSNIEIGLGSLQYPLTVFARIRLKTLSQWGDWFSFVAN